MLIEHNYEAGTIIDVRNVVETCIEGSAVRALDDLPKQQVQLSEPTW